jgi:hypothetical protein
LLQVANAIYQSTIQERSVLVIKLKLILQHFIQSLVQVWYLPYVERTDKY